MTDEYLEAAYQICRKITNNYSTSFSLSSRLFGNQVRRHIYAIYGLTRIADEIVDTYKGDDASKLLDNFESETYLAVKFGYSTNPILHAFQDTANRFNIGNNLIAPFFTSMRSDLKQKTFTNKQYKEYIHGSAEVVGLMCLKVFCNNDESLYREFEKPASDLGAAYQKVNFLRDIADDYKLLGRYYFPVSSFEEIDENTKAMIIRDIKSDFANALPAALNLPKSARRAVLLSYRYYAVLLRKLDRTPIEMIKSKRIRISSFVKLILFFTPTSWIKL